MARNSENKDQEKVLQESSDNEIETSNTGETENTSAGIDPIEEAKKEAEAILKAAKEEAAKIVEAGKAEAEATVKAFEEKEKPPEKGADPMEELVEYMAPVIMGKEDQTIFCQVNGDNIRIRRGETVRIKRKFVEVLEHAAKQEMAAFAYMNAAQKGSEKALADL